MTGPASGGLTERALAFVEMAAGPAPDLSAWQSLASGVAIDRFIYVGRTKEVLRWPDFVAQLDLRSRAANIAITVDRVEQSDNFVFLQLGERRVVRDQVRQLSTMTIFEFDAQDRLCRIDSFQ